MTRTIQELISLFNKLEASLVSNKLKQQLLPKVVDFTEKNCEEKDDFQADGKIVGGAEAELGLYPFAVSLKTKTVSR